MCTPALSPRFGSLPGEIGLLAGQRFGVMKSGVSRVLAQSQQVFEQNFVFFCGYICNLVLVILLKCIEIKYVKQISVIPCLKIKPRIIFGGI